jgi:hypothetical protein
MEVLAFASTLSPPEAFTLDLAMATPGVILVFMSAVTASPVPVPVAEALTVSYCTKEVETRKEQGNSEWQHCYMARLSTGAPKDSSQHMVASLGRQLYQVRGQTTPANLAPSWSTCMLR